MAVKAFTPDALIALAARAGGGIYSSAGRSGRELAPAAAGDGGGQTVVTAHVSRTIRILIIDEQGIMRDGLCGLLEKDEQFRVIDTQSDAGEALRSLETAAPDLIVIDLSHPKSGGPDTISAAKARLPNVKVLVLTFRRDDELIDGALRAGADGYVLKSDSREELFRALHSIAGRKGYISPTICERVVSGYVRTRDPSGRRAMDRNELTERERQVMRLIAGGHRTREMAEILSLSHKTVEKHRTNLMRKLGLRNASAVAAYAIANGYVEV